MHKKKCVDCGDWIYSTSLAIERCEDCVEKRIVEKQCRNCRNYFITTNKSMMFCCDECKTYYYENNLHKEYPTYAKIRWEVLVRDDFTCQYCGRSPASHGIVLHVDHVHPRCLGGEDKPENLITACEDCNIGKGGRLYFGEKDFRRAEKSNAETS